MYDVRNSTGEIPRACMQNLKREKWKQSIVIMAAKFTGRFHNEWQYAGIA